MENKNNKQDKKKQLVVIILIIAVIAVIGFVTSGNDKKREEQPVSTTEISETITESEVALDCSYTYDISATTTNTITDSSDEDLKVIITETDGTRITYTLKQLLSGVTHTGKIKRLTYGRDQTIQIEAYIENTSDTQNNLS